MTSALEFQCRHVLKTSEQKLHVFDPTPPPGAASRTKVSVAFMLPASVTKSSTRNKHIGNFVLTSHCLGSGSFASVHLAVDGCHATYRQVACKIIKKKKDTKLDKMMKEVRILIGLNHV